MLVRDPDPQKVADIVTLLANTYRAVAFYMAVVDTAAQPCQRLYTPKLSIVCDETGEETELPPALGYVIRAYTPFYIKAEGQTGENIETHAVIKVTDWDEDAKTMIVLKKMSGRTGGGGGEIRFTEGNPEELDIILR